MPNHRSVCSNSSSPITASQILPLNPINTTICHIVHILLNQRRRNYFSQNWIFNGSLVGVACFQCNFRVLAQKVIKIIILVLMIAILSLLELASLVEGMDMCRKSALSYNQQWILWEIVASCNCHVQLENWHQGCFHSPLRLFNIRALRVALYFSSDSRQGNYKLQQTEKERGESNSLSQKIVVVKLSPNSKLAYRKAEKNGVEEWKLMLSYQIYPYIN